MAETKRGVILRLSADGAEQVKAALRSLGKDGEEALRKLERSAKTVPPHLKLVNTASLEAQRGMQGLATRGGAATSVLAGLGPAGLAAAAGIGAVVLGVGAALRVAREATREFDELAKRIRDLGLDSDVFQGLSFAALEQGIGDDQLNDALRTFQIRSGEAAIGTGELVEKLKILDPELLKNIQSAGTFDERLRHMFDGISRTAEGADRARISAIAFGESNIRVGQLAAEGAAGIDKFVDRASALGLVISRDVLQNAEEMENKLGVAAKIVDINLKQAFIDLTPIIVKTAEAIAAVARGISSLIEMSRTLETKTTGGLKAELERIEGLLARAKPDSETTSLTTAIINTQVESLKKQRDAIEKELAGRSGTNVTVPIKPGAGGGGLNIPDAEGDRIRQVIEALEHQAGQLARTGAEQAAYNALVQAGIDENHAMAPAVMGAASALYQKQVAAKAAADALAETNKRIDATRALAKDALTSFISDLRAGKDATEALGNAIGKLGEKLLNSGIDALFAGLFPAAGGGGNLISSAVGLFHSGGMGSDPSGYRRVPASMFAGAPRFHSGIGPGERPAIIRNDEGVFTPGQMRALGGARGRTVVQIINNSGASVREERSEVGGEERLRLIIGEEIGAFDRRLPDRFAEIASDPRARG